MSALLLAPHYDDETLFAAYTILRHQPWVITCMGDAQIQAARGGPTCEVRRAETIDATTLLGALGFEWYPVRDDRPDPEALLSLLRETAAEQPWDVVFAPAVEDGGHDDHNLVGTLALEVWPDRVTRYLTYRRGYGRSEGIEVPADPGFRAEKFMAMGCYSSQIELDSIRPWFNDWEREWLA